MDRELFEKGLQLRRNVLGADHVAKARVAEDDFGLPFQEFATEYAWGAIWSRPGLDLRSRSILTLGMLCALNRPNELELHIRGAFANGVTRDELREILMQAAIYCGTPAAVEAFRCAREVFTEIEAGK